MPHAVAALVAAVSLLIAPITAVDDFSTPTPSPPAVEQPATPAAPAEPVAPPTPIGPSVTPAPVAPSEPETETASPDDPEVTPAPVDSAPPADLDEQIEEAITEQAADPVPGPFEPQPVPFTAPAPAAPQTLQCYGDSILGGVCGGGPNSPLGAALPGWTTMPYSLGGQWSTSIAVNAGAYRMQLTEPVTIAASGATNLPAPFMFEVPADSMGGMSMRASIGGVVGTLVHRTDLGITWRFLRESAGEAVTVAPGTPIVSLQQMAPGAASIIWVGTNNITAESQIVADVEAMVALHRSVSDQPFWVVSVTPAWGNSGSIYGVSRAKVNKTLEQRFGQNYVNLDEYIGNGALTDAGLQPTAKDREWIASGLNPPAFHSATDWIHFNRTGSEAIARFFSRFVLGGTTATQQRALFNAESAFQVDLYGSSITVRGWAFDRSDLYQRIPVGITIDDQWKLATFADGASPELRPYGVPGGHGFRWSTTLKDGATYKVCIVGVGIGAGQNSYPPCVSVAIPTLLPQGDMSLIDVGGGTMAVVGWGFDHADLYARIPVGIIIDGNWYAGITAGLASPYLRPYGVPGDHAFFQGAHVGKGTHSVCAVGVSAATGRNAILKCDSIVLT